MKLIPFNITAKTVSNTVTRHSINKALKYRNWTARVFINFLSV